MLSCLTGILLKKYPPYVLLDVHGVGYELQLPMTCFYRLPEEGQKTTLLTHFWIRAEAQLLYGFCYAKTRMLFRTLIKVNGIGPKGALAILSGLTAEQFIGVIARRDLHCLVKIPGIGKKTAERLLIEMRDHLPTLETATTQQNAASIDVSDKSIPPQQDAAAEAVAALVVLGYKTHEASRMVQQVAQPGAVCETLIRQALRRL